MCRVFFLIVFALLNVNCKNNSSNEIEVKPENKYVATSVIKTDFKIFSGDWYYESMSNENELLNKTFSLKLIVNESEIKGKYCAIARGGRKIDCGEEPIYNILGKIINNIAYVDFVGFYDTKAKGKAKIYFEGEKLVWKIISSKGEIFAPLNCILNKKNVQIKKSVSQKKDTSNIEGLYILNSCEKGRFKINIHKKENLYLYSILDEKKTISKGKASIRNEDGETIITFGNILGLCKKKNITIQNYGNSMNEYIHFIQCDQKYLTFIKKL